jgi:hypothetical protein
MRLRCLLYGVMVAASLVASDRSGSAQTPTHTPPPGMTCPGDRIVWVNIPSHIYHFEGERYFGSTKNGKFLCQRAADKEGDRPTRNGQ